MPTSDISQAAFVAPNAVIIGQVTLALGSSVWYGAVVRADVEKIIIGTSTNIQDGAILHGDSGQITCLEDYVTIGHRAVVHAAHIEKGCLIGIGAVILNGVRVGKGSVIGADSIVSKDIPARSLMVGIPVRRVRDAPDEEAQELVNHALRYKQLALVHAGKGTNLEFTAIQE